MASCRALCAFLVPTLVALLTPHACADDKPKATFAKDGIAFLKTHCYYCHGEKFTKSELDLTSYQDDKSLVKDRKVWLKVMQMLEAGAMPPKEREQPKPEEFAAFLKLIDDVFEVADRNAKPDPGHVTIRRLNRTEYNNTIRDLVGVDFQPAEDFPSDDVGHGFDNIGDVLSLSPVLLERYLAAAETIMKRAVLTGDPPKPPVRHVAARFLEPALQGNTDNVHFRDLKTKGRVHSLYNLTLDGDYRIRTRVYGLQVGDEPPKFTFTAEDKEYGSFEVKADSDKKPESFTSQTFQLKAGQRRVAVEFTNEFKDPNATDPAKQSRTLFVEYIELEGPLDSTPESHKRIMACKPDASKEEKSREILTRFATRAYRRPATKDEVDRLIKVVESAEKRGDKWDAGMQLALEAVLVSPKFLFRIELDDRPDSSDQHPIDEYQLASRLSYFLWSTMPDQELFDLAGEKKLTDNLEAQVRRMLKDPKAHALVDNFAMQWLQLHRLKTFEPDPKLFPHFDEPLRQAMLKETELFFDHIMREDRSVLELIDADYTFLNERLARHYGIVDTNGNRTGGKDRKKPGQPIRGENFVRVHLADGERGGLLTQASILTVSSNPTRTSPVKRGKWVLEQLLGTPPPPPPPNVPELPADDKAQLTGSLRQRMEQHRSKTSCANCHAKMDPLGFAFENYDAIGAYRTKDGDFDIDPSGTLPDGRTFKGPQELKQILKEKKTLFSRCLTEKLLTYATGRGLEYYDRRTVNAIVKALEQNDYRFSKLVVEICKSDPFRMRRGKDK